MQSNATNKAAACFETMQLKNCLKIRRTCYRKLLRIMKLAAIILLAACLQLSARGLTQSITISVKDAPLLSVLKTIEKQTDFVFFVNNRYLQKAKKVTIYAQNLSIQQVLELCFKDQPLTFTISGKVINIIPKEEKAEKEKRLSPPLSDVKGRVVDSKGQPVAGA